MLIITFLLHCQIHRIPSDVTTGISVSVYMLCIMFYYLKPCWHYRPVIPGVGASLKNVLWFTKPGHSAFQNEQNRHVQHNCAGNCKFPQSQL